MLAVQQHTFTRRKKVKNKSSYNLSLIKKNIEQVNLLIKPVNLSQYIDELIVKDLQKKQINIETDNFYEALLGQIEKDPKRGIIVSNKDEEEKFYQTIGLTDYKLHLPE